MSVITERLQFTDLLPLFRSAAVQPLTGEETHNYAVLLLAERRLEPLDRVRCLENFHYQASYRRARRLPAELTDGVLLFLALKVKGPLEMNLYLHYIAHVAGGRWPPAHGRPLVDLERLAEIFPDGFWPLAEVDRLAGSQRIYGTNLVDEELRALRDE